MDVLLRGRSIIDTQEGLSGFYLHTADDADRFMRSYGYDLNNPIEKAEILGSVHEALNFIRKYFLHPENPEGLKIEIPRKIVEITDVRDLLLMASGSFPGQTTDTQGQLLKNWSCSCLKVIHTIAHLDKDIRFTYFKDTQKQIFDRYYKMIQRDEQENLFLGSKPDDPMRVNLVSFETKSKKARESLLLKMLHKSGNVAEDIFDQVGIRFITPTPLESLRVLKYLKDTMIIMSANVKPSRTLNTLVDMEAFRSTVEDLIKRSDAEKMSLEDFEMELRKNIKRPTKIAKSNNPHSSDQYQAIQFTARQLIKMRNPVYERVKKLKTYLKATPSINDDGLRQIVEQMDLKYVQREVRFFYPYEVQIVDKEAWDENEKGQSAHSEYKKAQVNTAMRRVMGSLMDAPKG